MDTYGLDDDLKTTTRTTANNAYYKLFPDIPEKKWKEVNLEQEFIKKNNRNTELGFVQYGVRGVSGLGGVSGFMSGLRAVSTINNPMSNVINQCKLLDDLGSDATCKDVYNTYGGFGENRFNIWRGFEPSVRKMTHLGVNLNNLPPGALVVSCWKGVVCHTLVDTSMFNGWGGRIILKLDNPIIVDDVKVSTRYTFSYVMFGHLARGGLPPIGTIININDTIGRIGTSLENGGWFPHLHLQVMSQAYIDVHTNMEKIDGYDFNQSIDDLKRYVCDPIELFQ